MSIRVRSLAGLSMGIALSSQAIWAQKPGPISSTGGITGPGPSLIPSNVPGRPDGPALPTLNGGTYLTGNVMLDDGTPPPDPVTIERVCNGAPRAQAYTDSKGRFSFQIGQTGGVTQDASEDGAGLPGASHSAGMATVIGTQQRQMSSQPDTQLANCDLRAVLAGFRSDRVGLGTRRLLDDPNVGTIVLHRIANVEGSAVSMTSLQAPRDARRAYERALQDLRNHRPADAEKGFRKAVEIYPRYATAWYELGRIQQSDDTGQARKSFTNAIAADAKFISPYLGLAELEAMAENWAELAETTSKLLKLDAVDYPMAYFYNATANLNLGELDAAEKSARTGEKLDTPHRYPRLEQVLAKILALKKDYTGAIAHLRNYMALAPDAQDAARIKKELADLERLSGAGEQAKAATGGS
jgi:Tfp pilus assembly protein PilF